MKKNYIKPITEVVQLDSDCIMININLSTAEENPGHTDFGAKKNNPNSGKGSDSWDGAW